MYSEFASDLKLSYCSLLRAWVTDMHLHAPADTAILTTFRQQRLWNPFSSEEYCRYKILQTWSRISRSCLYPPSHLLVLLRHDVDVCAGGRGCEEVIYRTHRTHSFKKLRAQQFTLYSTFCEFHHQLYIKMLDYLAQTIFVYFGKFSGKRRCCLYLGKTC